MHDKIKRLRELLEKKHPGITEEEVLHKIVDEALEEAEADAEARAFHLTFREPAPAKHLKHLSLVTD